MIRTLSRVVDRIPVLRSGAPTTIMPTGYWNVFEGSNSDKDPTDLLADTPAL